MNEQPISQAVREEINDCLQLDEDALYSLIPPHLPEYRGAVFMTPGQIEAGKKEFEKRTVTLRERLCKEWNLCAKIKDPSVDDAVKLVVTIGDVIAIHTGGIPPFLVSSLLVKIGLRRFCNCQHEKQA